MSRAEEKAVRGEGGGWEGEREDRKPLQQTADLSPTSLSGESKRGPACLHRRDEASEGRVEGMMFL
jgi:hypothetical protein